MADLKRMYPEVAAVAEEMSRYNPELVWVLDFHISQEVPQNIARYRGSLTGNQVQALQQAARVPETIEAVKSDEWKEFARSGKSQTHQLVDIDVFDYTTSYNTIRTLGQRYGATHIFVNGRLASEEEFKFRGLKFETKADVGDVFVFVTDKSEKTAVADFLFKEMPLVEVYRAPERVGPFVHPDMIGKTPNRVSRNKRLRGFLGLDRGDKVVCPYCDDLNCANDYHQLVRSDELWVAKGGVGEEFLFAFQAANLVGSDGTAQLKQWAPLVIGKEVVGMEWPSEILSLELNGKDIAAATCGVKIKKGSQMKVVLRR